MTKRLASLSLAAVICASSASADEGMWTYNNFPAAKVKAKYGFEPTKDWLDHLRLSSVRIAGGCSASVVSPDGLVMTNHHCARHCIEQLSGLAKKDFNKDGFIAKTQADEQRCPGMELNQLAEITDVTRRVQDATKSVPTEKFSETQKATIAAIEKECAESHGFRQAEGFKGDGDITVLAMPDLGAAHGISVVMTSATSFDVLGVVTPPLLAQRVGVPVSYNGVSFVVNSSGTPFAPNDRFDFEELRCEVVTLYRGGRYDLYTYRRFQDIRLSFAPEDGIAFFGGDPDNFMFPRYDLDLSFVRIYGADGKPMKMEHFLKWSDGSLKEGDVTFVSGNPGGTSRGLTVAQLEDDRDFRLPMSLFRLAEIRGFVTQYQERGKEQKRHSNDLLFGVENGFKALKGRHAALADKAFMGQLVKNEADFRAKVKAKPELEKQYGKVWDEIATMVKKQQSYRKEYNALERAPISDLFGLARTLVRYGDEVGKPNGERLREFSDARLPQLKAGLLANRPIYDEMEIQTLAWSLTKMREELSPDHPVIKRVFGTKSPMEIAAAAVKGTKLKDLKTDKTGNAIGGFRKELFDGGKEKIAASKDPMLELARAWDAEARAIRTKYENEVDGPLKKQQELLAKARFAVYGDSIYPDATFTLRLSYGAVEGYEENGARVTPFTTLGGAFERHTGSDPFALPKTWLAAKSKLNLETPFNLATSNDIIGGNSGSPLVNKAGEVVGLVFDGNIQSLGGDYGFDATVNRTVAVHSAAMLEALDKVYGQKRLVDEIKGAQK